VTPPASTPPPPASTPTPPASTPTPPATTPSALVAAAASATKAVQAVVTPVKNYALCDTSGGLLPCSKIVPHSRYDGPSDCPDDLSKGSYFVQDGSPLSPTRFKGHCWKINNIVTLATKHFPGLEKYTVLTKGGIVHPDQADPHVVAFFMKRLVCTKGEPVVCHTYKVGKCRKCKLVKFVHMYEARAWPATASERSFLASKFLSHCLLASPQHSEDCAELTSLDGEAYRNALRSF